MAETEYPIVWVAGAKAVRFCRYGFAVERKIVDVAKVTPAGWVYVGSECFRPSKYGDAETRYSSDASLCRLTAELHQWIQAAEQCDESRSVAWKSHDWIGDLIRNYGNNGPRMDYVARRLREVVEAMEKELFCVEGDT